ncbi:MAG TPA: condensation domain-containing protein, partial [Polyangiaceae bacterium]|nr:condensation domain-containing protein [Polyangiaceae bacterium]
LPAPVPLAHRGRPELWLLAKSSAAVEPAPHRRVLVEDRDLVADAPPAPDEYPLSAIQFGIYLDELRFAEATYNNPFVVRVATALEPDRLRHAIAAAGRRHDMLRSRFVHRGERVVRVIDAEVLVDLRVVEGYDDEAAVVARARVDAPERFDLSAEHPLRVFLYPSASGPNHLLLCLHHIAGDVVSGFLVLRDILRAYEAHPANPWPGRATGVTYAEVAALREAASKERDARMRRWLAQIEGAPTVVEWPTAAPRPPRLSGRGVQISRVLPKARVEALRAAARGCRVTPPTFLFAALQALLHVKTRRRELVVGAVSLGRNNPAWLDVVGPLFNMLPVRSSVAPGCTFEQLARRTGTALIDTMVEDQIGFAEIVQRAHVPTSLDRAPLVQFLFNYIPKQGVADGADAGVAQIDVDWGTATFDVDVSARERGDDLVLTVKWSTDALDDVEGAAFLAAFDGLLDAIVADPRAVLVPADAPPFRDDGAAFWKAALAGVPAGVALETDGPALGDGRAAERAAFDLPPDAARALLDVAERQGAPPVAAFLAAFAVFLQRHSGQRDLAFAALAEAEGRLASAAGPRAPSRWCARGCTTTPPSKRSWPASPRRTARRPPARRCRAPRPSARRCRAPRPSARRGAARPRAASACCSPTASPAPREPRPTG